jgi:hypothetical protein
MRIYNKGWYLIKWFDNKIIGSSAKKHLVQAVKDVDLNTKCKRIENGYYEIECSMECSIVRGNMLNKVLDHYHSELKDFEMVKLWELQKEGIEI